MRRAVAFVLGLLVAPVLVPPTHADGAAALVVPEPVRILLVGDSVTQGSAGDWTWRYRLWQHLIAAGVAVDFVGPREDLWDNVTDVPGSTAYADPAFDRDHAARWGMKVSVMDVPISDLVQAYDPDVVVGMLGVNDLIWDGASPEAVTTHLRRFVEDARSVDPAVDIVLAEATQAWWSSVPDFNARLAGLATETSTTESPVGLAATAASYDEEADTWDHSHPNARGEVRIAAAVADALSELGVGPAYPRPLDLPPVGPRTGAELRATAGDGRATLSWTGPPGATHQYVWRRDLVVGSGWRRFGPVPSTASPWTQYFLSNGHRYEYRLQPVKGDDEPEGRVYSNPVTVLPLPPPAAPPHLEALRAGRRIELDWRRAAYADHYQVQVRRADRWRTLARPSRTAYVARDLAPHRTWRFRVRSWRGDVRGAAAGVVVRRR